MTGVQTCALPICDDETLAYYIKGTTLKQWNDQTGFTTLATGFTDPGNLAVHPDGSVWVTDRGASRLYRIETSGTNIGKLVVIGGTDSLSPVNNGALIKDTSLFGVRGICLLPSGGYLLATHEGSQVLYVDDQSRVHVLVDGAAAAHAGDGQWFYTPSQKISEARSVTMDSQGNILIVENDYGYVRKIDFRRLSP